MYQHFDLDKYFVKNVTEESTNTTRLNIGSPTVTHIRQKVNVARTRPKLYHIIVSSLLSFRISRTLYQRIYLATTVILRFKPKSYING